MVLSYYGLSCFKIQSASGILAIDPFGKEAGLKPPRFETGYIVFTDQKDKQRHTLAGTPVVFSTPGEYDIHGIGAIGFQTEEPRTPFYIDIEGIRIMHLGNINKAASVEPVTEHIGTVDILLVSAPNSVSEAAKITKLIDPRITIPMQGTGSKKLYDTFIKELSKKPETADKLTIKKKGLPTDSQRIIVLKSQLA